MTGTIGKDNLVIVALVETYLIESNTRNRSVATCKSCGTSLPTDHGREIEMLAGYGTRTHRVFFCADCFSIVKAAYEKYDALYPDDELLIDKPWWGTLDREPQTKKDPWKAPDTEDVLTWLGEGGNGGNEGAKEQ